MTNRLALLGLFVLLLVPRILLGPGLFKRVESKD